MSLSLIERIKQSGIKLPSDYWKWTSVLEEEARFKSILRDAGAPFNNILEIGTCFGIATVLLAEHAEVVDTIDVVIFDNEDHVRDRLWCKLGVRNKIRDHVFKKSFEKENFICSKHFDLVFIDGCHMMESVGFDYQITKHIPIILFHDYGNEWGDVTEFVNVLVAKSKITNTFIKIKLDAPFALLIRQ